MAIVEVHHISKQFQLGQLETVKLKFQRAIARLNGQPLPGISRFKALDDVHFTLQQGEVLGIIGSNGAGKSTLLKILSRITAPSAGYAKVNGRVAPLIEVGAGLVGDLTGRENIYLNGAILGLSRKEVSRKFDEIVDFAELQEFIDTPIKRYSSGMAVRLGFSIAAAVDAEILIVDEVLAVGDLAFQRKCFDRMEQLIKRQNKTVLLVSHNIRQVERMCSRVILLEHGKIVHDGEASAVCRRFYARSDEKIRTHASHAGYARANQHGTGELDVLEIQMLDQHAKPSNEIEYRSDVTVVIRCRANVELRKLSFGLGVHTTDFVYLATDNTGTSMEALTMSPGIYEIRCLVREFPFLAGVYALRLGITAGDLWAPIFYAENIFVFQVISEETGRAESMRDGFIEWKSEWCARRLEESRRRARTPARCSKLATDEHASGTALS
jgi:ABC-type polysaccharide/polyol phosphate transport system ATPase subunit